MDEFRKEIADYSSDELQLILTDQRDLYTPEELKIIQEELNARGGARTDFSVENAVQSTLQDQLEADIKSHDEKAKQEQLAKMQQEIQRKLKRKQEKISRLKQQGHKGYWEYRTLCLVDDNHGVIDPQLICDALNELALDGWHLKCSYANEVGSNSQSTGVGGFSSGTNSTIDQNIFILERFIEFKD